MGERVVGQGPLTRPRLGEGTNSSGFVGRTLCRLNPEKAAQNLENFRAGLSYLQSKYGNTPLISRLATKLSHYESNRRGMDGDGGRLREFTDSDLRGLEREEVISSLNEAQRGLLEGIKGVENLSKSQIEYIARYCENMINGGSERSFALEVGKTIALLFNHDIESTLSVEIMESLSRPQIEYLTQYCKDMVNNGYKQSFAAEVGIAMVLLFNDNIESVLPTEIDINNTVFSDNDRSMRQTAIESLSLMMEAHGASYADIAEYQENQQQESWSTKSLCMKYFLLQQRENAQESHTAYYLNENTEKTLQENYDNHFSTRELDQNFQPRFSSEREANEAKARFPKSVIIHKAFIGIVLKNLTKITCDKGRRGIEDMTASILSREGRTIKVQRGAPNKIALDGPKQGIADSTALGRPSARFNAGYIAEYTMPFCDIHDLFFMSPTFCCDGKSKQYREMYGMEHEIVCDLSHASRRIIQEPRTVS
jgi:hypothetical protein